VGESVPVPNGNTTALRLCLERIGPRRRAGRETRDFEGRLQLRENLPKRNIDPSTCRNRFRTRCSAPA